MSELVRFGVSLESQELVKKAWQAGDGEVAGAITFVYDHHGRSLLKKITDIQHGFQEIIISTQHIHLDHDNCLEIVAVKGKPTQLQKLADMLKALKGVRHGILSMSSTGSEMA
jgi:CopG family nickel-responsive transcriptional regulator